ncbi:hypothetical protein ACS0TY_024441 [Phlomoides rotata]
MDNQNQTNLLDHDVMGDKFLARELTVENTAPPQKHQAVALMVTTNAAFSRCEIKSHQDTLYAHSLRQLYHDSKERSILSSETQQQFFKTVGF